MGAESESDTLPLHHLREVDKVGKGLGLGVILSDIVEDDVIAYATLLVSFHHRTLEVVVLGACEALDTR